MCGITAIIHNKSIISKRNIIYDLYESLYHLQHRGQDGFGISYLHNGQINVCKYKGLLSTVDISQKLNSIKTTTAIGHVRYPTFGDNTLNECQPFYLSGSIYNISLVHNGQIWITDKLKEYFNLHDIPLFNTTSDTGYLISFLSYHLNQNKTLNYHKLKEIINELYNLFEGSYNCICMIEGYGTICFKDPNSIRPLILGYKNNSYIISSESVSITSIDYDIIGDIYGNELHVFKDDSYNKMIINNYEYKFTPCIFEWIYLAREESVFMVLMFIRVD